MADGALEVRGFACSRPQNATEENAFITFSDIMTFYVHSGHEKSHLGLEYERYSRSSAPTRSVGYYILGGPEVRALLAIFVNIKQNEFLLCSL
jgi:hypothetical protein